MSKNDKQQALVPRLRFPEFQDKPPWNTSRLGDFATIVKGKGISKADITSDGALPAIRYAELYTVYDEVIREVVSRTNLDGDDLVLSQQGDVIIPASGETKADIATAATVPIAGVALGSDLNVIRSHLHGAFFSYYLNGSKRADIAKVAQGDTVAHLYPGQLEKIIVHYPKPDEQQKIADCLGSLDDLIAAEGRKLAALRDHKKGLMQKLFPREGETCPRLRFPEFRDAGEWHQTTVGDIIRTLTPPKRLQTSEYMEQGDYPVVDQSSAPSCGHTNDGQAVISENLPVIIFGDHTCVVKFIEHPFAQGADGIKILKGKPEISDEFLFHSLQANPVSSSHYKRHFSLLKEQLLMLPNRDSGEQQRIADCLSALDSMITAQAAKLDALRTHKRGLMQQLFPSPEDAGA